MIRLSKPFTEFLNILILTALLITADWSCFNSQTFVFHALIFESTRAKAYLFLASYVAMTAAVAILLLIRRIAWVAFLVTLLFVLVNVTYSKVNGAPFSVLDLETFYRNWGLTSQAVSMYWGAIIRQLATAIAVYGTLFALSRKFLRPISIHWIVVACLALGGGVAHTIRTAGSHVKAFPQYVEPAYVIFYDALFSAYSGPRDQPYFVPREAPRCQHLIFVMDESVRGDLLEINGYPEHNTPYLKTIQKYYLNYGVASSFTNSSLSSNESLMAGLAMDELPDVKQKTRHGPQVFDYAKQAVRQVYFIWGQDKYEGRQKRVNAQVKILRAEFPALKTYQQDRAIIDYLDKITAAGDTSFTWVNKWGCHFDYEADYPPEQTHRTPVFKSAKPVRTEMLNSYFNCLEWAVDGFLQELLSRLEGRDVVIVYTSDHGQSIMEKGVPGTHNRTFDISASQASVPVLVFGTNAHTRQLLALWFRAESAGRVSAEQIFPTLLWILGYGDDEVNSRYPRSLFDHLPDRPRVFLSGDIWALSAPYVRNIFRLPDPPDRAAGVP
ncbi:MAG: sulfatase-like hydrolase/transferase [Bryobacteraceae bacterium]